jgi:hypothetical protein
MMIFIHPRVSPPPIQSKAGKGQQRPKRCPFIPSLKKLEMPAEILLQAVKS